MSAIFALVTCIPHERAFTSCFDHGSAGWKADGSGHWSSPECTIWAALDWNSPESKHETQPFRHVASGVVVAADARLDNRADLLNELCPKSPGPAPADSELILLAWLKWGPACPDKLLGDFAFLIWDPRSHKLFCARDGFGCRPLYYTATSKAVIVASDPGLLLRHPEVNPSIDQEWILDQLAGASGGSNGTPFSNIRRVPAGHLLTVNHLDITLQEYWRPAPGSLAGLGTEQAIVEHGRHLLDEAVRCRIRSSFPIGAELTGGLDSGGIVATAVSMLGESDRKLAVFSRLRDSRHSVFGPDESEGVDLLCRHLGITDRFVSRCAGPGLLELLDDVLNRYGMPLSSLPILSEELRIQAAGRSVRTMLSGYGGDDCFSAQESTLPFTGKRTNWGWRWQHYAGRARRSGLGRLRCLAGSGLAVVAPCVHRYRAQVAAGRSPRINDEVHSILTRETLCALSGRTLRGTAVDHTTDRRISDLRHPALLARIEASALLAMRHKQVWTYPLLDRRLVEFALACPPEVRTAHGWTRRLARLVIEDRVPPELAWQPRKLNAAIPGAREQIIDNAAEIHSRLSEWQSDPDIARLFDFQRATALLEVPQPDSVQRWASGARGLMNLLMVGGLLQRFKTPVNTNNFESSPQSAAL